MQTVNSNAQQAPASQPAQTASQPAQPLASNALGQFALYSQAQAQKAQAQAQRLANAVYVLIKPSKANLQRQAKGNNTQAQTNANYAAAIMLQVYPLLASSGLNAQQLQASQQAMLKTIYTLQIAANTPASKQAVQQQLPPK